MKLIRVINISNRAVTINNTVIDAHKVKDFPLDILSKDDLEDIASYSAVGVIRAFEYEDIERFIQDGENHNHSEEEADVNNSRRGKRK